MYVDAVSYKAVKRMKVAGDTYENIHGPND